jgi:multiple sugar transport system permease protein
MSVVPYLFLLPAIVLLVVFNLIPAHLDPSAELLHGLIIRGADPVFVGIGERCTSIQRSGILEVSSGDAAVQPDRQPAADGAGPGACPHRQSAHTGIHFFRSIYLLPVAVSINVTVVVWGLMVDPNAGLLNGILNTVGACPNSLFSLRRIRRCGRSS